MFEPTQEQLAIIDAAKNTNDNLIISALAGAAKTSTLVLIAKALASTPILCLAFNKKIAVEMTERLPGNCQAMTLNSIGHRAWSDAVGKRLVLNTRKTYELLTERVKTLDEDSKSAVYENFSEILRMIDGAKTAGYVPTGKFENAKRLMDDDELFNWFDEEPTELEFTLVRDVIIESIKQAYHGIVDFNDQIYMSTLFNATFPAYPLVLVDEAQDLSALNHAMLKKIARKRLIAVGDECQAIYGFRGAHEDSMNLLQTTFSMKKLILSTSFRCPRKVVEAARWRAPHMKYPSWAIDGEVRLLPKWKLADIPDNSAIICRNNAPLFSMALKLLKDGRYPKLLGNDIGKMLLKILTKFGKDSMPQKEVFEAIEAWKTEKLKKSRSPGSINDQAECLYIFAEAGKNLGDAVAYAQHIFNSEGPIQLMTGHKSKGLEFDDVFILDIKLIRVDDFQQEKNLKYVMQTRAKRSLTYIDREGLEG